MKNKVANIAIHLEVAAHPSCLIIVKVTYVFVYLFGMTDETFVNELIVIDVKKRFNSKFESAVGSDCHCCCLFSRMAYNHSEGIPALRE